MQKWNFCFGPYGNWITTLPHICHFYPPKMRCYDQKLHHMYHACRITVKFKGFSFSQKFSRNFGEIFTKQNFAKIVPFSHDFCIFVKIVPLLHDFRIFAKIETFIFVSTLLIYFSGNPWTIVQKKTISSQP
jgi:hypothetical protein